MGVRKTVNSLLRYFFLALFLLAMLATAYGVHRLSSGTTEKIFLKEDAFR